MSVAVLALATAHQVIASEKPIIINGHLVSELSNTPSDESIPSTDAEKTAALPTQDPRPTVADTSTPKDDAVGSEISWGYPTPSKKSQPRIRRTIRPEPPWAYKVTNKRYTPRPHREYQRKLDWNYRSKRSFRYRAKSDWTYHPAFGVTAETALW